MKQPRHTINGWINLNKPLHFTSADAVNKVKYLLRPQKIGHAGTLDPLATGVLPLALGEGTKCINLLMDAKKTYEFSVTFGERRSTDDAEGEVVATSQVMPTAEAIQAVLPRFTGPIMQLPPIYSALKVAGRRAYDMARAGEEVVLEPRPVTIHALEFLGLSRDARETLSPCGRGLGEGGLRMELSPPSPSRCAGPSLSRKGRGLPAHVPLAQENQIKTYAKQLREDSTDVEVKLWQLLRARRLDGHKFRRQQRIDNYIVDFVCLDQRLIVELDGGQHSADIDQKRTAYLESQGFRVLRFWNNEVLENIEGVWETLQRALLASPLAGEATRLSEQGELSRSGEGAWGLSQTSRPLSQPSPAMGEGSLAAPPALESRLSTLATPLAAHFRATVSKGTYIRSLGRDIAQALGTEGYISRLHRAAVGPFTDGDAISLDFVAETVHNAPLSGGIPPYILPLHAALDDIPALALDGQQLNQLRHGQRVTLSSPTPDAPQIAVLHEGQLVALARIERNQVIAVRVLVF